MVIIAVTVAGVSALNHKMSLAAWFNEHILMSSEAMPTSTEATQTSGETTSVSTEATPLP